MADFLLELLSEEIPARMQPKARDDLARLFEAELAKSGLKASGTETYSTPRRLALIARDLPPETQAVSEELKGPRTSAPPQALEGFLRKTGLTQDQLTDRDGVYFAQLDKPGRPTAAVLADAIPAIVRAFPWPKSMRWGAASHSTESLRWVRPLQGVVALFGEDIVACEIDGIQSAAATVGHRFHHPGRITIGSAEDYAAKLRACHVIVDHEEREAIIATGATTIAAQAGLTLVRDEALLRENAGLTEWPVPLLGSFDQAFLDVPPEVIQLTMATNQKYFAVLKSSPERGGGPAKPVEGSPAPEYRTLGPPPPLAGASGPPPRAGEDLVLAPNFICTANLDSRDRGATIVAGNQKVLAARLSDAKFFWEQDLKIRLENQAKKLDQIVFHEKLGTVADKVERVAKLARWLVEEGVVGNTNPVRVERSRDTLSSASENASAEGLGSARQGPSTSLGTNGDLATRAETAARLCKADLVTGMVGEFPELQGIMGGYYARAQGHDPQVADAIRDHYKPVGQGDEVPTSPVTVAVSLADKLDTLVTFFFEGMYPSGSKDPFALRRQALSILAIIEANHLRLDLRAAFAFGASLYGNSKFADLESERIFSLIDAVSAFGNTPAASQALGLAASIEQDKARYDEVIDRTIIQPSKTAWKLLRDFFADRLKVQQREAGVRHDLIDAVFALGGEDDLVRLLARVKALQSFVETPEGRDLLAGYKRAANILKKENFKPSLSWGGLGGGGEPSGSPQGLSSPADAGGPPPTSPTRGEAENSLSYTPLPEEQSLIAALDAAEPRARAAVEAEDFEGAMTALASLRGPVDAFFEKVTVNDADPVKREARLNLLARMRDAVHQVADFSRIDG